MKTFTFDLKKTSDLLEIAKKLSENNITIGDSVILQLNASSNIQFNENLIEIFKDAIIYRLFIDACRTAISSKQEARLYIYPSIKSYSKIADEFTRCLTENTKINFIIERIGNQYCYSLPETDSFKEINDSVFNFIVGNSIMSGDKVYLQSSNKKLDLWTKLYYFHSFSSAINTSFEINNIPALNIDESHYTLLQSDEFNFNLTDRLSYSGIEFRLEA
jgi:hypothetical protein